MQIEEITKQDFEGFWPVFKEVVAAQETYAFEPDLDFESAYQLWCKSALKCFAAKENGKVLGSYYLKANGSGPSNHICNCGYMVSPEARGKGLARAMCEHSQQEALTLGFMAMQFNSVVSSNEVAVQLWRKLGYQIVGTIPNAYRHKRLGLVDTYVMYKALK